MLQHSATYADWPLSRGSTSYHRESNLNGEQQEQQGRQHRHLDRRHEQHNRHHQQQQQQQQQQDAKRDLRRRQTRSTRGCLTCRQNKVKCDEVNPTCERCQKSRRDCRWPSAVQLAFPRKSKRIPSEQLAVFASEELNRGQRGSQKRVSIEAGVGRAKERRRSMASSSEHLPTDDYDSLYDKGAGPPISMDNSYLARRRKARRRNDEFEMAEEMAGSAASSTTTTPPIDSNTAILLHGIDIRILAKAVNCDQDIVELGPLIAHTPPAQLANANALKDAFPSPIGLQLFHYFYQVASQHLVTMGESGVNPILTLCTPARLLDTSCAAAAALRMSILSVSLAHISNDLRMSKVCNEEQKGPLMQGIQALGAKLKTATLANIVLVEEDENDQFDTVLASCVLTMIRDVISADITWHENFEYAIRMVTKRGGPEAVLNEDRSNFTRRFLLENLAAHDVFSCFITRKEPALLDRFEPWWYSCVDHSSVSWEWESVERTFGISRGMLEFLSRVVTLDAQKRRLGINFQQPNESMQKVEDFMQRQAESLLMELDVWCNGLNSTAQHVRVKCGDYIYKYSANVFILGSILDRPCESTRIAHSIEYVLELCSEATALRQVVMLVWPLLICSSFCLESKREKILELVDAFQDDYCEDLQVARELMLAQWKGIDGGLGRRSFRQVMDSIDKNVLLI